MATTDARSYFYGCVSGLSIGVVAIGMLMHVFYQASAYHPVDGGICALERGTFFHGPAVSWRRGEVLVRESITFLGGEPELGQRPPGDILAKCLEVPESEWIWVVPNPAQK